MPIQARYRWFYPVDWRELSAMVRFQRAAGRCEGCGRPHGALVCHLGDGRWWDQAGGEWRDGQGRRLREQPPAPTEATPTTRVYLAAAHRDHDPTNSTPRNLAALCQRCHMLHDRPEHQRRRMLTLRARKALGDLFQGPYNNLR